MPGITAASVPRRRSPPPVALISTQSASLGFPIKRTGWAGFASRLMRQLRDSLSPPPCFCRLVRNFLQGRVVQRLQSTIAGGNRPRDRLGIVFDKESHVLFRCACALSPASSVLTRRDGSPVRRCAGKPWIKPGATPAGASSRNLHRAYNHTSR